MSLFQLESTEQVRSPASTHSQRRWPGLVRRVTQARVLRRAYSRYALLLILSYLVLYVGLLASTNSMPYVMDNNESFSSLTHAENMFSFGIDRDFGLTDEAYGPSSVAHPYVYT